jgi:hypothetical protein
MANNALPCALLRAKAASPAVLAAKLKDAAGGEPPGRLAQMRIERDRAMRHARCFIPVKQ